MRVSKQIVLRNITKKPISQPNSHTTVQHALLHRPNLHRITASASLMRRLRVASSFRRSSGAERISMSSRFPSRSRTWIPVVPASPSIKTVFLASNDKTVRKAAAGCRGTKAAEHETSNDVVVANTAIDNNLMMKILCRKKVVRCRVLRCGVLRIVCNNVRNGRKRQLRSC